MFFTYFISCHFTLICTSGKDVDIFAKDNLTKVVGLLGP